VGVRKRESLSQFREKKIKNYVSIIDRHPYLKLSSSKISNILQKDTTADNTKCLHFIQGQMVEWYFSWSIQKLAGQNFSEITNGACLIFLDDAYDGF
jgi:hypothetical protein